MWAEWGWPRKNGRLTSLTEQGVLFWSAIYIPVVVAMAAKQNVIAAIEGGPAAILAGVGAVGLSFLLVPILSRIGREPVPDPAEGGPEPSGPAGRRSEPADPPGGGEA